MSQPDTSDEKTYEADSPPQQEENAGRTAAADEPPQQFWIARYGSTRSLAEFSTRRQKPYRRSQEVILRTDRGQEWGELLCVATDQVRQSMAIEKPLGKIIRPVNRDDERIHEEIRRRSEEEFNGCAEMIAERKLQMQLVDVEHLFGGERLVFYYLAEKRVDFRELVKALAKQFKTRIEMRQIGVRDEARLLADYGDCGKPVCCNTHLSEMPPIGMKMAKLQKATLDPTKISGRCGRLKCCLRYEYDTYKEYQRSLPPVNSTVILKSGGEGRVIAQEILARKVLIQAEGSRRMMIDESDIMTVVKKPRGGGKSSDEPTVDADGQTRRKFTPKKKPGKKRDGRKNTKKPTSPADLGDGSKPDPAP